MTKYPNEFRVVTRSVITETPPLVNVPTGAAVGMIVQHAGRFARTGQKTEAAMTTFIAEIIGIILMVKGFYEVLDETPDLSSAEALNTSQFVMGSPEDIAALLDEVFEKKSTVH